MYITLPSYIDVYDELLKKGYEGKCAKEVHDECCPYGVRVQILILREISTQEALEAEKDLENKLMWMMEQDKVEVYKVFFDGAFWTAPFRHAADLITQDGIDTFVAYLKNCLGLGDINWVLQNMKKDVIHTKYADKDFNADEKAKKKARHAKKATPKGHRKGAGPGKEL